MNNARKLQEAIVRCYVSLNNYNVLIIDKREDHASGLRFKDLETLLSAAEHKPKVLAIKDFVEVFCRIGEHYQQDIYHKAKPIDMAEQVIKYMKKHPYGIVLEKKDV